MRILSGESLVFLPGLDGTGISFEPLSRYVALDAQVSVVRYPSDQLLSFSEIVDCAADQVSSAGGAVVVAESFSGPVAIELIASGRLKAKCLILCATFAKSPRPALLRAASLLPLAPILRLPVPGMLLRPFLGGAEYAASLIQMWHRVRKMVPPEVLAHRLRIVSRVDVRNRLPGLSVPCCYLQADDDRVVPPAALLDFVGAVPDFQIERVRGPHFLLQANPEECAAVIEKFYRER